MLPWPPGAPQQHHSRHKVTWIPTFVGMTYKGAAAVRAFGPHRKDGPDVCPPGLPPHPTLSHGGRGALAGTTSLSLHSANLTVSTRAGHHGI